MPTLEVPTRWVTIPAKYRYLKHTSKSTKLAVLFPGHSYTLDAPLMWYSIRATFEAGCDVLGVEYGYQANRTELDIDEIDELVTEVMEALKNTVTERYSSVVFVGKSIGTVVQSEVAKKVSFPVRNHIFLTPLRPVVPFIR